jgi:hypothetical protein
MKVQDLEECDRLAAREAEAGACLARFAGARRSLLAQGRLNAAVAEDVLRPAGARIAHFGISAFVTDACVQQIRARPPSSVGTFVMERIADRDPVILDAAATRRANSGLGLNLVVLEHLYATKTLSPEQQALNYAKGPESFLLVHQGYRLKEILGQFPEQGGRQFALESGFLVRDAATHLLGITRQEARAGTYVARAFVYQPPHLFLSLGEQQMLQCALEGSTDEELAAALCLALPTIKTRWRSVYTRVAQAAPHLLPEAGEQGRKRGTEKRRPLLDYLRHHPEELRPHWPKSPGA